MTLTTVRLAVIAVFVFAVVMAAGPALADWLDRWWRRRDQ
jgi:hypothetical protein